MIYWGLFSAAFLSATILPGGSEVIVVAAMHQGHNITLLWLVATLGNVLGTLLNWLLGRYFYLLRDKRWFPFNDQQMARGEHWFKRWGVYGLLFAWVPVIGDAITLAAGLMRVRLSLFLLLVTISKGCRYAVLIAITAAALPALQ